MKYSTKLSDAVHIMAFIAIHQEYDLSSTVIADSIQTNPAFVRQIMMKLKKAGLMSSVNGHAKPSLAKPTEEITLLDIYKAVEGSKPLLHLDTHTNPDCAGVKAYQECRLYFSLNQNGVPILFSSLHTLHKTSNTIVAHILTPNHPKIVYYI